MSTDTGLESGPSTQDASIAEFVQENVPYYSAAFPRSRMLPGLLSHGIQLQHFSDPFGRHFVVYGGSSGPFSY